MWAMSLISFALWIGYGVFQARRSSEIRDRVSRVPRSRRVLIGAGLMILGIAALFVALMAIQSLGAFSGKEMTIPGWLGATFGGLMCVHCQTLAMAMLVSVALEPVTNPHRPSSSSTDPSPERKT